MGFESIAKTWKERLASVFYPKNLSEVVRDREDYDSNSELRGRLPKGIDQQIDAMRRKSDTLRYQ